MELGASAVINLEDGPIPGCHPTIRDKNQLDPLPIGSDSTPTSHVYILVQPVMEAVWLFYGAGAPESQSAARLKEIFKLA
jgi:hypothetical protein